MAQLTTNILSPGGTVPTSVFVAADAGGDTFQPGDGIVLHVKNDGAGSVNVTLVAKNKCSHGFLHDEVIAVNAGEEKIIGKIDTNRFMDKANGLASITYSDVTNVSVAVYKTL